MARCPRLAAPGSPGTSSVSANAMKGMPSRSSTSAPRRRARNRRKGWDGSGSRRPSESFLEPLAADAGWINRPGRVVVGAGHALARRDHLARLDQREERTVRVQLPLDLLEELTPGRVVGARARLRAQRFEARVGAGRPSGAEADELSGEEEEIVVGVGVVRAPKPQAELLFAGPVVGEGHRDRAAGEVDLDPGSLQV